VRAAVAAGELVATVDAGKLARATEVALAGWVPDGMGSVPRRDSAALDAARPGFRVTAVPGMTLPFGRDDNLLLRMSLLGS